jgi:hypothetical protein
MKLEGATHFQCYVCNGAFPASKARTTKFATTSTNYGSDRELRYFVRYILICEGCLKNGENKGLDKG